MRFALPAVLFMATMASAQTSTPAPVWNYLGWHGSQLWGHVDPAWKLCDDGHAQSPVNIHGARLNKKLPELNFHYITAPVTLENNGRTILAHVTPGSYVTIDGVRYDLVEFDFHIPGETAVQGKLADMEIHLLHKSADGRQIVIAVRLMEDINAPNGMLAALWPSLPKKAGETAKPTERINVGGLLPADRGYWSYDGSLSTPPCTEGVRWYVFEQTQSIGRQQLKIFSTLFHLNTRPLQDLRGRHIEANE